MMAGDGLPTSLSDLEVSHMRVLWTRLPRVAVAAGLLLLLPAAIPSAAATGDRVVAAVRRPPALIGWGANPGARHDIPRRLETAHVVLLAAGNDHDLAVTRNGTLVAWGTPGRGEVPAALDGVRVDAIAAGGQHSLAVTEDGRVVAWGANRRGQTDVPAQLKGARVIRVAAGAAHSLALTAAGNVVAWGDNRRGQTNVPAALDGVRVTQVDAGDNHSLALTADGDVVVWGANDRGQTDVPAALNGVLVTRVAAGGSHNLALTEDGTVVAWGANSRGQTDVPSSLDGARVTQIAAGQAHSLALTGHGRLVAWGGAPGDGVTELPTVLRGVPVRRIAAGDHHNLVLARYRGPVVQIWHGGHRVWMGNNFFDTRTPLADLGGQWEYWLDLNGWDVHTFRVRVYNDTDTTRAFRIRGSSARIESPGRPRWDPSLARYYHGKTDLTGALRSPRGIVVRLKPGEFRQYRVWVSVVPWFVLIRETSAVVSATQVGHPRRSDRVKVTTVFSD